MWRRKKHVGHEIADVQVELDVGIAITLTGIGVMPRFSSGSAVPSPWIRRCRMSGLPRLRKTHAQHQRKQDTASFAP